MRGMALSAPFLGGAGRAEITDHHLRSHSKYPLEAERPIVIVGPDSFCTEGLPGWRRGQDDKEAPCAYSTEGPMCCGKEPRAVGRALEDLGSLSVLEGTPPSFTKRQAPLHGNDCHGDALGQLGPLCQCTQSMELGSGTSRAPSNWYLISYRCGRCPTPASLPWKGQSRAVTCIIWQASLGTLPSPRTKPELHPPLLISVFTSCTCFIFPEVF